MAVISINRLFSFFFRELGEKADCKRYAGKARKDIRNCLRELDSRKSPESAEQQDYRDEIKSVSKRRQEGRVELVADALEHHVIAYLKRYEKKGYALRLKRRNADGYYFLIVSENLDAGSRIKINQH